MNFSWGNAWEIVKFLIASGFLYKIIDILYKNRSKILTWARRQKLKWLPVNFNVVFSLDFKEGLNSGNYYDQIKKNFIKNLNELGLDKQIKVKDFSDIRKFEKRDDAEKFRNKKKVDLIIWGGFSNDFLKDNGENVSKLDLNFTYGHPESNDNKIGAMILLDISSRLATKNYWKIIESNSFRDVEIVSNNLFDIATYILALTLKIYGQFSKSLSLFEKLYSDLERRQDLFKEQIVPHLINCYEVIAIEEGLKKKNFKNGIVFCKKILSFYPEHFFAIANLAVFQYKSGEVSESEENVELLLKVYPKNPLTEIDVAFFRILQKKYSNALKHYNNFIEAEIIEFDHQEAVEFLYEEYKIQKDPALLFGSGIISWRFGDKILAKKDLQIFIRKGSERVHGLMHRRAKQILSKINIELKRRYS